MGQQRYSPREQEFYKNYIRSPAWRIRKEARIRAAGMRCEFVTTKHEPGNAYNVRCTRTNYLCVHHNTYERLGNELDKDLDVFCWPHHMIEHLLWKKCCLCGQPCLINDEVAELWLTATLVQMGINLEHKNQWFKLPNKEQLSHQIHSKCMECRGVNFTDDDE